MLRTTSIRYQADNETAATYPLDPVVEHEFRSQFQSLVVTDIGLGLFGTRFHEMKYCDITYEVEMDPITLSRFGRTANDGIESPSLYEILDRAKIHIHYDDGKCGLSVYSESPAYILAQETCSSPISITSDHVFAQSEISSTPKNQSKYCRPRRMVSTDTKPKLVIKVVPVKWKSWDIPSEGSNLPADIEKYWRKELGIVARHHIGRGRFGIQSHTFENYTLTYRLNNSREWLSTLAEYPCGHPFQKDSPTMPMALVNAEVFIAYQQAEEHASLDFAIAHASDPTTARVVPLLIELPLVGIEHAATVDFAPIGLHINLPITSAISGTSMLDTNYTLFNCGLTDSSSTNPPSSAPSEASADTLLQPINDDSVKIVGVVEKCSGETVASRSLLSLDTPNQCSAIGPQQLPPPSYRILLSPKLALEQMSAKFGRFNLAKKLLARLDRVGAKPRRMPTSSRFRESL